MDPHSPLEKSADINELERNDTNLTNESEKANNAAIEQFTPEEQHKIMRRIDRRLVLTLGFLYCVSLMDRTNTGIAAIAGMAVDLVLIDNRYSIIVLLFFITYVLLQPPATVVLRKLGPRYFLPSIVLLWGITMMCGGFVKTWTDFIAIRLILGVFEAGFFPGCAYLLSCWYPRFELQKRNAVFYLIGSMASAFAGILAYGFSQLKNHGSGPAWWGQHYGPTKLDPTIVPGVLSGIAGWRWIFILQGVLTCVLAIGCLFLDRRLPGAGCKEIEICHTILESARGRLRCRTYRERPPRRHSRTVFCWQISQERPGPQSLGIRLSVWFDNDKYLRDCLLLAHYPE